MMLVTGKLFIQTSTSPDSSAQGFARIRYSEFVRFVQVRDIFRGFRQIRDEFKQ